MKTTLCIDANRIGPIYDPDRGIHALATRIYRYSEEKSTPDYLVVTENRGAWGFFAGGFVANVVTEQGWGPAALERLLQKQGLDLTVRMLQSTCSSSSRHTTDTFALIKEDAGEEPRRVGHSLRDTAEAILAYALDPRGE